MASEALAWDTGSFGTFDRLRRAPRRPRAFEKVVNLLGERERGRDWGAKDTPRRRTTEVENLVRRLQVLERYEAGWDGRAGAAANPASFDDARSFAYLLGAKAVIPEEGLHANGNAVLTFEADGIYASLQFCGDGLIGAYMSRGDEEWDDDVRFDGKTLPAVLRDKLGLAGTG